MATGNKKYETVFIVDSSLGEEAVSQITEKFKTLIEQNATLDQFDEWGKRKLAYEIDYKSEGNYVLATFTAAPEFPAELDRIYKITDGIMRSIIIAKDAE